VAANVFYRPVQLARDGDNVIFENYDDTNFGFLRITVGQSQLGIGYQPVPGNQTTGDSVAVIPSKSSGTKLGLVERAGEGG
jgi:hypothetical protein